MKILTHRGYWKTVKEKNSEIAFQRSFSLGYGCETDIRDADSRLVISHDMPNGSEMQFDDFFSLAAKASKEYGEVFTIALNVKSDGLAPIVRSLLDMYPELDSFVFDMSVPDMRSYFDLNVPVFTRMSEFEQNPVLIDLSSGVWLDGFESEWYDDSVIKDFLSNGMRVCVVSPELHNRSHLSLWERIKPIASENDLMLCTDLPDEASQFFL